MIYCRQVNIYDGERFDIVWTVINYFTVTPSGYVFGICPEERPNPPIAMIGHQNCVLVNLPESMLGQKVDLNVAEYDGTRAVGGILKHSGVEYSFYPPSSPVYAFTPWVLSGDDNWLKVTEKTDVFVLEFNMTIGGKLLKGKRELRKTENYVKQNS